MLKNKQGICYVIVPGQRDDNGIIPSVVKEGETGHFPLMGKDGKSPCHWGHTNDAAQKVCDWMNEMLGLSRNDVDRMVGASMRRVTA